ncbi:hypothetical protein GQ42DRAFT_156782 [Ramicandelaber brevisporus]|nr:hypothetical protein GQ42DRAFT_156782 [Ramicandelaber brevisporus]
MIRQQQIAAQKLQKQQQQPQPQQSGYDARKPQLEDWPPHQYHPRLKNTWLPRIAATIAGFIISVGSEFTLKIGNVGLANSAGFRGISIEAIFHPASTVDMTIPQLHGTSGLAKDCRGILREFMEMCIPPQMGINLDVLIQAESCVMIIPPSHPLRVWPSDEGSELLPELSQQIKPSHCHPFNEMHTGCQYIFLLRKHNIL